jgi:hypothetical protein
MLRFRDSLLSRATEKWFIPVVFYDIALYFL